MVSGASSYTYWTATYAWDMANYVAIVAITLVVFVVYRDEAFIGTWSKAAAVTILFSTFGFAVVPLSYVYSFGFSNHANAQVRQVNQCEVLFWGEIVCDDILVVHHRRALVDASFSTEIFAGSQTSYLPGCYCRNSFRNRICHGCC